MTFTHALATNNYGEAKFIVATSAANGTHTTLATAMSAASSGDTIFLRDSVTENVTITPGVNIAAWTGSSLNTPSITGKLTMTGAGTSTITGITLITNSDFAIAVTGSAASILRLRNCYLNFTNNTGISYTSSSSSSKIEVLYCNGDLGTTGIALHSMSSAGTLQYSYGSFTNSGASTTASSNSAGNVFFNFCGGAQPLSTSSTGVISIQYSNVNTSAQNATALTTAGTGTSFADYSDFVSGTASAISIGSGTTVQILNSGRIDSTNTNAITGAGTLKYRFLTYTNTSITQNVTTATPFNTVIPCFLAIKSGVTTNATGDGTLATVICDTVTYDLTSNYNNSTGVFTAPITGKYHFDMGIAMSSIGAQNLGGIDFATTARTYFGIFVSPTACKTSSNTMNHNMSVTCDMTAGDTATLKVNYNGSTKTVSIFGDGTGQTFFGGYLVA